MLNTWIGTFVLDADGEPVPEYDIEKWAAWFDGANKQRRVADTRLESCRISTVFLGLDHSFMPILDPLSYRPLLWETMVFGGEHDGDMERYQSRELAEAGHAEFVSRCEQAEREAELKNA